MRISGPRTWVRAATGLAALSIIAGMTLVSPSAFAASPAQARTALHVPGTGRTNRPLDPSCLVSENDSVISGGFLGGQVGENVNFTYNPCGRPVRAIIQCHFYTSGESQNSIVYGGTIYGTGSSWALCAITDSLELDGWQEQYNGQWVTYWN